MLLHNLWFLIGSIWKWSVLCVYVLCTSAMLSQRAPNLGSLSTWIWRKSHCTIWIWVQRTTSLCTYIQMLSFVVSQEERQSKEEQGKKEGEGEGEEDIYSIPSTSTTQQGIPALYHLIFQMVEFWHFVSDILYTIYLMFLHFLLVIMPKDHNCEQSGLEISLEQLRSLL